MKKYLLFIVLIVMALAVSSQDFKFYENFDTIPYGSKVTSSNTGAGQWGINTTLSVSGLRSDSCVITQGDTVYLTTNAFSTLGYTAVYLEFQHICKIEFFDAAEIEVSANNGATWTKLTSSQYMGTGQFGASGDKFTAVSYVDWLPANNNAIPTNAWWKNEKFNISSVAANVAQVKVRFVLSDVNNSGSAGNYGWLLDDINVWVPSAQEATVTGFELPFALPSGCGLSNETVQIKILNSGGGTISGGLTASFQRQGMSAVTETVPNTILTGDTLTYTFTNKIDLFSTVDTNYLVNLWINLLGDPNQSNDSIMDTVASLVPLPPPVCNDTTIPFGTSVTLHAVHQDSLIWYADPQAQTQIGIGSYYTTPVLLDTSTFYVQGGAPGAVPELLYYKFDSPGPSVQNFASSPVGNNPATITGALSIGGTGMFGTALQGSGGSSSSNVINTGWQTNLSGSFTISFWTSNVPASSTLYYIWGDAGAASFRCFTNGVAGANNWMIRGGGFPDLAIPGAATMAPNMITAVYDATAQTFKAYVDGVLKTTVTVTSTISMNGSGFTIGGYSSSSGLNGLMDEFRIYNRALTPAEVLASLAPSSAGCPSIAKPVTVSVSGVPQYNAGITEITSPKGAYTQGAIAPVTVTLKNFASDTLKKVNITYSVNGVAKAPYLWTGNLAYNQTTTVTLGTDTFAGGAYNYRAWTSMPNDSADGYTANDTANSIAYVCLSGTFTLGTPASDFPDFATLQTIINNVGLCGNTVIRIMPGTYTGQHTLQTINGASDSSRLIFESFTGINTDVILEYSGTAAADNWTIRLDGADYVTFRNMTIKNNGASYGRVVEMINGAMYNVFQGNRMISGGASNSNTGVIYDYTTLNHFNSYIDNYMEGGYYSIYLRGTGSSSTGWEKGSVIQGNEIVGSYYYPIYIYYADSVQIVDNYIHDGVAPYSYGISAYYINNGYRITGNRVDLVGTSTSACYGIRDYYGNYASYNPLPTAYGLVANNMISITGGTGTNYGLYSYYGNGTKTYYNTVNIATGSTSSRALYQASTATNTLGQEYKNNIFVNTAGGYAAYYGTAAQVTAADYNDYLSTGAYLTYWNGNQATMAAHQSASGKDGNSKNVDPGFTAPTDLHASSVLLNASATPVPEVLVDIDAQVRDTLNPDIGADEFIVVADDAGVIALLSPQAPCPGDTVSFILEVKNFGTDTLFGFVMNGEFNGVAMPSFPVVDTIPPAATIQVYYGDTVLQAGISYTVKAWTSMPNGVVDLNIANDTLWIPVLKTSMPAGTFTIGPDTTDDYSDFASAVSDLNAFGVCGPVVFQVDSGTYAEKVELGEILGASAVNTITFESASGDSTDVILEYALTSSAEGVIFLNGADYITFRGMTIRPASGASYGRLVYLTNGANHNTIESCVIQTTVSTSSSYAGIWNNSGSLDEFNTFRNNVISGGYYGVYCYGSSTTSLEMGNVFEGNRITDYYYYGMLLYYQDGIHVIDNYIRNASSTATNYPVYLYYCDNALKVTGNDIVASGTSTQYGLRFYYCDATASSPAEVSNNMIAITGGTATNYAIYLNSSTYYEFYYNSISMSGGSASSYAMYLSAGSNHRFLNNVFSNTKGGYAFYAGTPAAVVQSDYNNLYSTGNVGYWSGAQSTLTAWQNVSSMDAHSISADPSFLLPDDLHTTSAAMNGAATPVAGITMDIDGELRDTLNPDIGADEFVPPPFEGAATAIILPSGACDLDSIQVMLQIVNTGSDTIIGGLNASYTTLGSSTVVTEAVNDTILMNDTLVHTFAAWADIAITGGADTTFDFKGWIDLTGDYIHINDTALASITNGYTPPPPTVSDTTIQYASSVTIFANSPDSVTWFQYDTSSTPLATGAYYTTPLLYDTTVFWAAASSASGASSGPAGANIAPLISLLTGTGLSTGTLDWSRSYDGDTGVYGTQQCWISTSSPPNGSEYIEWQWASSQTIGGMKLYLAQNNARTLTGATVQYWDGSTWVNHYTWVQPQGPYSVEYSFPPVNTDKIRLTAFMMTGTGQTSNPNFREIEIYLAGASGCLSQRVPLTVNVIGIPIGDLGIADVWGPTGCGLSATEPIAIDVYNQGIQPVNGGFSASYRINGGSWITPESVTDTIGINDTITYTFSTPANLYWGADTMYEVEAYVALALDPNQLNDTLGVDSLESLYTPADPVVTSPVSIAYGNTATLNAISMDTLLWYENYLDTVAVGGGSPFITQPLYDSTTFWVQAGSAGGTEQQLYNGTQSSIYTSTQTRGYWFLAPIDMTITSLQVPTTVTAGLQCIQVVKFIGGPPAVYSATSQHQDLFYVNGVSNPAPITVSIQIAAGDYIGIIGANNTTGTTMANSYGQSQVPSFIDGNPVVLTRLVYQASIATAPAPNNSISQEVSGSIARVEMTYVPGIVGGCSSSRIPVQVLVSPPPPNDAGALLVSSPIGAVVSNTSVPIEVIVKNFGADTLNSVNVTYEIDGIASTPYSLSGMGLAPGDTSLPIQVGTETFAGGTYTIRAWTSMPNNAVDTTNLNDTTQVSSFNACLNGTYTIGPDSTDDFSGFMDAITAMDSAGICGNVTFLVDSGVYVEQVYTGEINGAGPNARITFQGATGDSTDVVLTFAPSASTTPYVLLLNGADYFTFRNMSIKGTGTSYGQVVYLQLGANHNIFENNEIATTPGQTSSSFVAFYNSSAASDEYNTIRNNRILNGYYGIYNYGTSASYEKGNVFENNIIRDYYVYGALNYYQDSLRFTGNNVKNGTGSNSAYGIFFYYCDRSHVLGNTIVTDGSGTQYGIYMSSCDGTAAEHVVVANNFYGQVNGSGTVYGMYISNCTYADFVFNTINATGGSTTASRCVYQTSGSNLSFLNNILCNTAGGFAAYFSTPTAVSVSDYNDLYTNGTVLAYWSGNRANLAALQAASSKDAHSVSVNPGFYSFDEVHVTLIDLNAAATPYAGITTDIDGETRHATTPDIGADEFTPIALDAGVASIDDPVSPVTAGSNAVKVTIKNYGVDTLVSATIGWSVNGSLQLPYSWSGSISTGSVASNVTIGNYIFTAGASTVKAWTTAPNAGTDGFNLNDTSEVTLISCAGSLSGVYTIGGTNPDFPNFGAAVQALNYCGVSGAVTFNVASGIYNENISLDTIPGASSINTVTFQSSTGDSTDVVLSYAPTGADNYILRLNGTKFVTFHAISMVNASATMGRVLELSANASYNTISSCVLTGVSVTTTSNTYCVVYSYNSKEEFNTLMNNRIENGSYGIYFYGPGSANLESGNSFIGNEVVGYYYYGVYLYYQNDVTFDYNLVENSQSSSTLYPVYLYYCDGGTHVVGNQLRFTGSGTCYGLRVYYNDATAANPGLIANNFISQSASTGTIYGLYFYYSTNFHIYNNSFNITAGSSSSRALYAYGSSAYGNYLKNNSFANFGGGYSVYVSGGGIQESDNNNFWSTGSNLGYWNSNFTTVANLTATTAMDSNSISVDPNYLSLNDLHVTGPALNAMGTPVQPYVTIDIDGQPRDTIAPDIGADEYSPSVLDIGTFAFVQPAQNYAPAGNNVTVEIQVKNFGSDTVTSFTAEYQLGSGNPITSSWTGILMPNATVNVLFATPFAAPTGGDTLCARVIMAGDGDSTNNEMCMIFTGVPIVVPNWADNFDGTSNFWVSAGTHGLWERGVPAGNTINQPHSSPNVYATNLGGYYQNNENDYLYSPFYDFSNIQGATMKFWHMYQTQAGQDAGNIQVTSNGGSTWSTLGFISDPLATNWYTTNISGTHTWSGSSSNWVQSTYDLSTYDNASTPIQFRFRFFSNASTNNYDGWAIDDFEITLPQVLDDVGVIAIVAPATTTVNGSQVTVTVRIANFGYSTQTSIPVSYSVAGGTPVSETWTGTLGVLDTVSYTFTATYTSPAQAYQLCARTNLVGDSYPTNDETCANLTVSAAPYDVAMGTLIHPQDTVCMGHAKPVSVVLHNKGTAAITTLDLSYTIGAGNPVNETWNGTLQPGDSVTYTFNTLYMPPAGIFLVCVNATLMGDPDLSNNQVCNSSLGRICSGIGEFGEGGLGLSQNRPNPTRGMTTVDYYIPSNGNVVFEVVNLLGQPVYRDASEKSSGLHTLDLNMDQVPAGVYYYTLHFNGFHLSRKMIVE